MGISRFIFIPYVSIFFEPVVWSLSLLFETILDE